MAVKSTKAAAPAPKKSAPAKPAGKAPAAVVAKPAAPVTVTLKNLSASLAERHGMAKKQADGVLADVFEMLVTHLKSGERVRIGGLGILEVKNRPARMGRNPATGAAIEIKASKKIAFRAAKELKDAI
jgi:DNA-binding protein HU-beta